MAIELNHIRKSFDGREVLKRIDFTFEEGKINMVIGASGSGKSVMLKLIVGLMDPDEGQVLYEGVDFHHAHYKEKREIRKQIGMLFQGAALFDSLNVEENVAFPLRMFTQSTDTQIRQRVNECLSRVNLEGANHKFPAEISGGMKKRVGIARAIALNPRYLFVDEPNSGLDPLTSTVVDRLIQDLTREYNMTTIIVSHDMNSVINIGDKVMFLYKGEKSWEGNSRGILSSGNKSLEEFVFVSDLIRRDL